MHFIIPAFAAVLVSVHSCLGQWDYHDNDSPGHVCKIDYGLEPDYIDNDECAYYWSCEDYWGTLQRCHGTDQFHFQYRMCMNDDDVSCYVQMEKYDHGHNYDHIDESYSRSKTCEISHGLEPNMYDEGCKSFWSCEDHQGTLHECPTGFQFDWEYLDCMLDKEVICEKQMEWFYQYVYHDTVHPHPEDGEEGGWKGGDGEWSSWSGSDSGSYDYPRVYHGEGSQQSVEHMNRMRRHRCEVRYGREPDYASPICASYWLCDDHHGNLQHCPHGYLFHWYQMECLREEDVDCRRQREGEGQREGHQWEGHRQREQQRVRKNRRQRQGHRMSLSEILQGSYRLPEAIID